MDSSKSGSQRARLQQVQEGTLASVEASTADAPISSPDSQDHARRASVPDRDVGHRRLGPDLCPERAGGRRDGLADTARATARDAPGAECAVDLAHVVVEQDVGRAGERTPWKVPMMPDADMVALSGAVSNHWSRKSAALMVISCTNAVCWRRGSLREVAQQPAERHRVARIGAPRVERRDAQDGLDEARHLDHQQAVLAVCLGIRWPTSAGSRASSGRDRPSATGSHRRGA